LPIKTTISDQIRERESVWWVAIVLAEERTKLESGSED